jgi:DNA-binding CsgD family transcriptional regulator
VAQSEEHVLIDRIYEAALRPELWPDLLELVSDRLNLFGGVLIIDTPKTIQWSADRRMHPIMHAFVEGGWHKNNSRMAGRIRCDKSGFLDEFDLYSKQRLPTEPVYVRHFRPKGLGWSASTLISGPRRENIVVDFEQLSESGPVSRKTKDYLDTLRPHFARSLLISAKFASQSETKIADWFQMLDLPAFVVDEHGCVVAMNKATAYLDDVVSIGAEDRLIFADKSVQDALMRGIRNREYAYVIPRSISTVSARDRAVHVAQIMPLTLTARDLFSRGAALVYFTNVGENTAPAANILSALFDLTPRESEVAKSILLGMSAKLIADRSGVSVETVRMQIKSILSKAGVNRQVELSNLLSTLVLPRKSRSAGRADSN